MDYDGNDNEFASATQPTQTLPQTQEVNGTQSICLDHEFAEIWGRLDPLLESVKGIDFINDEYHIGRNASAEIRLTAATISNNHAYISVNRSNMDTDARFGVTVWLHDTSTNGTYLNGERVGKGNKSLLKDGDIISLPLRPLVAPQRKEPGEKLIGKPVRPAFLFRHLANGNALRDHKDTGKYVITNQVLGTGNFAEVRVAVHEPTGLKVAAKCLDKKRLSLQSMNSELIMKEAEILHALHHPCVIKIEEMFETDKYLYIMLELISGGALFEYVQEKEQLCEVESMEFTYQMLKGLQYLHANGVTHRDMKPENVLLLPYQSEGNYLLKITDFGLAKIVGDTSFMQTMCGTPNYLAPEIMNSLQHRGGYTNRVDCWSLGVVVYIMLVGRMPFDGDDMGENISKGIYSFPNEYWEGISNEAIEFIKNLLCVNPDVRYTTGQALQSPWFKPNIVAKADATMAAWETANRFKKPQRVVHTAVSEKVAEVSGNIRGIGEDSQSENKDPLVTPVQVAEVSDNVRDEGEDSQGENKDPLVTPAQVAEVSDNIRDVGEDSQGENKDPLVTPVQLDIDERKRNVAVKRRLDTVHSATPDTLPVKVAKLGL
eukprot:CFRG3494T1